MVFTSGICLPPAYRRSLRQALRLQQFTGWSLIGRTASPSKTQRTGKTGSTPGTRAGTAAPMADPRSAAPTRTAVPGTGRGGRAQRMIHAVCAHTAPSHDSGRTDSAGGRVLYPHAGETQNKHRGCGYIGKVFTAKPPGRRPGGEPLPQTVPLPLRPPAARPRPRPHPGARPPPPPRHVIPAWTLPLFINCCRQRACAQDPIHSQLRNSPA